MFVFFERQAYVKCMTTRLQHSFCTLAVTAVIGNFVFIVHSVFRIDYSQFLGTYWVLFHTTFMSKNLFMDSFGSMSLIRCYKLRSIQHIGTIVVRKTQFFYDSQLALYGGLVQCYLIWWVLGGKNSYLFSQCGSDCHLHTKFVCTLVV